MIYNEEFERETDYEDDELYRPKKQNSRKSLAPAFVYRILCERSSPDRHISQTELIKMLEAYPYEITLERKAIGRIIHGLADSGLGIMFKKGEGCWYDQYERWRA